MHYEPRLLSPCRAYCLTIAAVSPASEADMNPRLLLVALKSQASTEVMSFMAAAAAAALVAAAGEPGAAEVASAADWRALCSACLKICCKNCSCMKQQAEQGRRKCGGEVIMSTVCGCQVHATNGSTRPSNNLLHS